MQHLSLLVLLCLEVKGSTKGWKVEDFPQNIQSKECRSEEGRVCDPDGILTLDEVRHVEDAIQRFEQTKLSIQLPSCDLTYNHSLEIGIAMVEQMDIESEEEEEDDDGILDTEAERFARILHNIWGVGSSQECGNGILFFLSIKDRVMYLSVGTSLTSLLTTHRIQQILNEVRPVLRQQKYRQALSETLLQGILHQLEKGPPFFYERTIQPHVPFALICFFFVALYKFQKQYADQQRRDYAQLHSQLSQMDQDRALALMGQYRCTSCPICFESFQPSNNNNNNTTTWNGHDGRPIQLLRCGHAFDQTCWEEWIQTGQGDVRKCPICKQDISSSSDSTLTHRRPQNRQMYEQERQFRFTRLRQRYPRFISSSQIRRWTDSNYDGSSLVRDTEFVRRNPDLPSSPRTTPSSSSFGDS